MVGVPISVPNGVPLNFELGVPIGAAIGVLSKVGVDFLLIWPLTRLLIRVFILSKLSSFLYAPMDLRSAFSTPFTVSTMASAASFRH